MLQGLIYMSKTRLFDQYALNIGINITISHFIDAKF